MWSFGGSGFGGEVHKKMFLWISPPKPNPPKTTWWPDVVLVVRSPPMAKSTKRSPPKT